MAFIVTVSLGDKPQEISSCILDGAGRWGGGGKHLRISSTNIFDDWNAG